MERLIWDRFPIEVDVSKISMTNLRVPSQFYSEVKDLRSAFIKVAKHIDISEDEVSHLWRLLPILLQKAPAFCDRLTGLWRYDFGMPIDRLPEDNIAIGTHMFPPVDRLRSVKNL